MGKCSGMLLLSDYDNTFCYTEKALSGSGEAAPVNPRNLEAVRYWMAEGGRFAVATGRALAAFRRQAAGVPMNAPAVVDNGGAIYDFAQERYLVKNFLPERALWHIAALMDAFPTVSLELYHEDDLVQVMRPRAWNDQHAKLTGLGYEVIEAVTAEKQEILDQIQALEEDKSQWSLRASRQRAMEAWLDQQPMCFTEYDDTITHKFIERITVVDAGTIQVKIRGVDVVISEGLC